MSPNPSPPLSGCFESSPGAQRAGKNSPVSLGKSALAMSSAGRSIALFHQSQIRILPTCSGDSLGIVRSSQHARRTEAPGGPNPHGTTVSGNGLLHLAVPGGECELSSAPVILNPVFRVKDPGISSYQGARRQRGAAAANACNHSVFNVQMKMVLRSDQQHRSSG